MEIYEMHDRGNGFSEWAVKRSSHRALIIVALGFVQVMGGCHVSPKPIFAPMEQTPVWPPRPAPTKVLYVGQLQSSSDLGLRRTSLEWLGGLFVGEAEPESLYGPRAVLSLPEKNHVWIADPGGRCLHLFDFKDRHYSKITTAGENHFLSPVGLARGPDGSIFVCDSESAAIYRLSGMTGAYISEVSLDEVLQRPVAMHYDAESEELFVVDAAAHDVKVIGRDGKLVRVIGRRGNALGEFNFPLAIAADGDTIWVVDTGNHRVQGLSPAGEPKVSFGGEGDSLGSLALPKSIAIDNHGHLYVVDARFENVQVFNRKGELLLFFGEEGVGPGEFWLPTGINIDSNNRIWVCDSYNRRLQVFDYVGHDPAVELVSQP